jgi:hypothetical protein
MSGMGRVTVDYPPNHEYLNTHLRVRKPPKNTPRCALHEVVVKCSQLGRNSNIENGLNRISQYSNSGSVPAETLQ